MVQLLASLLLRVALLPLFEISSTSQKQFFFFWNHHFFKQLSGQVALVKQITILDRIKWINTPHHPPPPSRQNPGWSRARAKTRHLPIIDLVGGGGGPKFSVYFVQDVGQTRQTNAPFCYQGQMLSASVSKLKQMSLKRTYVVFKFNKQILRRALARPW